MITLRSAFGFAVELPDGSFIVDDSSAGPDSEQISVVGDVLLTVVREDVLVQSYPQVVEWSEKMAQFYLSRAPSASLGQGRVTSRSAQTYATIVGYVGAHGQPLVVATVGMLYEGGPFLGLTILWPVIDPAQEPDYALVRRVVSSFAVVGPVPSH